MAQTNIRVIRREVGGYAGSASVRPIGRRGVHIEAEDSAGADLAVFSPSRISRHVARDCG